MNINKLINWHEVSRQLSGEGQNIRANSVPKRYQRKINRLLKILEVWLRWAK
jgi:predicted ABC-type ATPase